jgi:hypothetical protein
LEYSRQPTSSIAVLERRADGSVTIAIPPFMRRKFGPTVLIGGIVTVLAAAALTMTVFLEWLAPEWFLLALLMAAIGGPVVGVWTWMGCRWTIVHASEEGVRRELRGLLWTRRTFWRRRRIGKLRLGGAVWIFSPRGLPIGVIHGTDTPEEMWLADLLRQAMDLEEKPASRA